MLYQVLPGHHKEILKTSAYSKVKNSLIKRFQTRRIWITLTELKKIYIDEDGNLQFGEQFLEEMNPERPTVVSRVVILLYCLLI